MLRVIGLSSCLPEGIEVMFEQQFYNVFDVDVSARSTEIIESLRAKGRAAEACA